MPKLQHGGRVPLHPTQGPVRVSAGELVPYDSRQRKVHIVELEVGGEREGKGRGGVGKGGVL